MNSAVNWMGQKDEWEAEDPEGMQSFLEKHRRECLESYPDWEEVRYCTICGEPLKYGSMAYDEGWHFDSCL